HNRFVRASTRIESYEEERNCVCGWVVVTAARRNSGRLAWPVAITCDFTSIAMGNGICRKDPATALAAMGNSAILSDVEIWQVVTFLNNLQSLPEPVAAEWKTKR